METHRLLNLPSPSPAPVPLSPNPNRTTSHPLKPSPTNLRRCSATSPRSFGDSNTEGVRTGRFEFRDEEPVRFEGSRARRKWWYDDDEDEDEEEEDEEEEDEEENEEGFGVWEETGGLDWIFKLLKAFGWMLPAVIISLLVGTPNTLIMALALPLGQSAISLVLDKLWGGSGYREKPRSRAKTDPFVRASSRTKAREKTRERSPGTSQQPRSYQSWTSMNHGRAKHGGRGRMNFGGWDELDKQGGESGDVFREKKVQDDMTNDDLPRQQANGKLSRGRNKEKPLFFRLLIAVFPFLGSWTRLFL